MLVAAMAVLVCAPAAGAAAPFEHDETRTVLLVHDYQSDGSTDCAGTWGRARCARSTGRMAEPTPEDLVGYYTGDHNCDVSLNGRYSRNASIRDLGRALAISIYRRYTSKDQIGTSSATRWEA